MRRRWRSFCAGSRTPWPSSKLAANITPHPLAINRNAMVEGGIRPHVYCLPVVKRETHRLALHRAATSGSATFFLGADSAPHAVGAQETACGCTGVFNAPFAIESYAKTFDEEGAVDHLEAFASENGARFYGLSLNDDVMVLERGATPVPGKMTLGAEDLAPFHASETLDWSLVG